MRSIIRHMLGARRLPVVVWVAPDGARAGSAGVFITMASDVAAMAPQTNIGSSTPISGTGGDLPADERRKIVNDAAAYIEALARSHGRNAAWARQAVTVAANVPADEALRIHVVDLIAPDLPSLLRAIDGRRVAAKGNLTIHVAGARVTTSGLPLHLRILETLIDPNVIFLLFAGGIALIAFEIFHPGVVLPGVLGGTMLVLSLFGLSIVPFHWAGLLLLVIGMAMIVGEAHAGHGALGAVGVVSLVIGALLLFDTAGTPWHISIPLVAGVGLALGSFFMFAVSRVVAARHQPPQLTIDRLVGSRAEVREPLDPEGLVYVDGALWQATTDDGHADRGATVVIDRVDGLRLHVHAAAPTGEEDA
jgi:membrane-bound serine protease (ClpP class)